MNLLIEHIKECPRGRRKITINICHLKLYGQSLYSKHFKVKIFLFDVYILLWKILLEIRTIWEAKHDSTSY